MRELRQADQLVGARSFTFIVALGFVLLMPSTNLLGASSQGASLFQSKCVMCHGADGGGNTPVGKAMNIPDLRSPQVQKQSDVQLAEIISKGKGKMPANASLSAAQVKDLVSFLRSLTKKK